MLCGPKVGGFLGGMRLLLGLGFVCERAWVDGWVVGWAMRVVFSMGLGLGSLKMVIVISGWVVLVMAIVSLLSSICFS